MQRALVARVFDVAGCRTILWVSCVVGLVAARNGLADLVTTPNQPAAMISAVGAFYVQPAAEAEIGWLEAVAPANLDAARQAQATWVDTCPSNPRGCLAAVPGTVTTESAAAESVVELPPPPGSRVLTLAGVLMLGARHLARSARQAQFIALPEWYHANCPTRIGHAVAFDLDIAASIIAVCCFVQPAERRPVIHRGRQDAFIAPLVPQYLPAPAAPRGPPAC
ncbi:MAG: hypothetical protein JXA69_14595 [Phycisphaerae bacterium]|nr:hypothetical protein [Phycisphaerae bacterium]